MIFKKKQDAAVQQTAAGEAKPAAKGGKAAAFFRKNWKWMVPVVCVAVLGGWFILRPDKAQNANKDINYVQVSPSKRDVSNTLSGRVSVMPSPKSTVACRPLPLLLCAARTPKYSAAASTRITAAKIRFFIHGFRPLEPEAFSGALRVLMQRSRWQPYLQCGQTR